jgi:predicted DNA binding protein
VSVLATFTVRSSDFVLDGLFEEVPDLDVRLASMVPMGTQVMPYFWVSGGAPAVVEAALEREAVIDEANILVEEDGKVLFRATWSGELGGLIGELRGSEAAVLEATGTDGTWEMRVRFPDHDTLSAFYERCTEHGISLELGKIHNPIDPHGDDYGLTPEQRETLLTALEGGYYAVPRQMTLEELGDELGISDNAVSQRLRRGLASLLTATLLENVVDTKSQTGR